MDKFELLTAFFTAQADALRPVIREEVALALAAMNKPEKLPDRIRIDEAAKLTGYSRATIYSKVCNDEIPFTKTNGRLYFSRKKLTEWMGGE